MHRCSELLNKLKVGHLETDVAASRELLYSSRYPTIADAIVLAASVVREDRIWRKARMWKYDALHISEFQEPVCQKIVSSQDRHLDS